MHTRQIIVVGAVCAVMGTLMSLEIHKAGKPAEKNSRQAPNARPASQGASESALSEKEATAKIVGLLSPAQKKVWAGLAGPRSTENLQKPELQAREAFWKKAGVPEMAGLMLFKQNQGATSGIDRVRSKVLTEAGDLLRKGMTGGTPSLTTGASAGIHPDSASRASLNVFFAQQAVHAYQKALELSPDNAAAQTGLGVCYVTAGDNPMEGIGLLLGVVKKDPENIPANFNLGLFSMRSGQYTKAIARFKSVVSREHNGEAWFYLGQAYEASGDKTQAASAYQNSKKYISDPAARTSIDHLIQQSSTN